MLRAIVFSLLILSPQAGQAGAWLREPGAQFVVASYYANDTGAGEYLGIYYERGVSPRLTLGLDLGRGISGSTKTIGFVRVPLGRDDGAQRLALDLGLGEISGRPTFRPVLSYGRGFSTRNGGGWFSVETAAEFDLNKGGVDYKADVTLGLSPTAKRRYILQLQAGRAAGDDNFLRLVPSATFRVGRRWQLEIGVTQELTGDWHSGIKLGAWAEF